MNRRKIILSAGSVLLLALAVTWAGPLKLWQSIMTMSPTSLAGMLALLLLNIAGTNVRFWLLLRQFGADVPLANAYRANSTGQTAALFFIPLLAQVAGRNRIIEESGLPKIANATIAIVERSSVAALSLLMAALGMWRIFGAAQAERLIQSVSVYGIVITLILSAIIYLVFVSHKYEKFLSSLILNAKNLRFAAPTLLVTLFSYAATISCFSLAVLSRHKNISIEDSIAAAAIISFSASIPISIGGWGLRELAAIIVLERLGVEKGPALAIAVAVGALSTIATLLNSSLCLLLKPAPACRIQNKSSARRGRTITRISTYAIGVATASLILFQLHASFEGGTLNINLADPFAVLTFASFCIPMLTRREFPRWESRSFNLSLILFGVALLVAFFIGWSRIGVTSWALGGRVAGWMVVTGYLLVGYSIVHHFGRLGFSMAAHILGVTASCIIFFQLMLASAPCLSFLKKTATLSFEGFAGNRNAFAFQLITITCLLLPLLKKGNTSKGSNLTIIACLAFCSAGVLLSCSRTGQLVLVVLYLLSTVLGITSIIHCLIVLSASAAIFSVPYMLNACLPATQYSHSGSDHLRFKADLIALKTWLAHPLFGSGLGTFIESSASQLGVQLVIHSTPIWILSEFGLFGFSIFLFMAWVLCRHIRSVKAWSGTPQQMALFLTLVAFTLFCQLHEVLYQRIFWLALGVTLAVSYRKNTPLQSASSQRTAADQPVIISNDLTTLGTSTRPKGGVASCVVQKDAPTIFSGSEQG